MAFDSSALLSMKTNKPSTSGFSILEVMITAAIIGVITGIVVLKYGAFNNLILLKNQAFQIALDLRATQTKALSAQGQSGTAFRYAYGLYFSTAAKGQYIIFADSNDNGVYTTGEEIDTRKLDSRFEIASLCNGTTCNLSTLSVLFKRPNFDAIMNAGAVSSGRINVLPKNAAGATARTITVNSAGQISVQ